MARLVVVCALFLAALTDAQSEDYANNEAVQLLQEYVQMNTTTYNDLTPAVQFWQERADSIGLEFNKYEFAEGFPVVVLRFPGANSSLSSIMLNSHMDVVPADESEGWTYPPFSGYLDSDGVIWGRGTQDIKGVSIQYFEALKRLKANNVTLLRDVYMTLMPDEEVGAEHGMILFLASEEYAAMNVGVEMDEGTAFDLPVVPLFYQDKVVWQIQVDCYGPTAHSSTFPATNDTAIGKCYNVMNKMYEFRESEYNKYLQNGGLLNSGSYSSINLNIINGGTADNVIPGLISMIFDIRLATSLNEETFDAQLKQWISEAGDNITLTYILKNAQSPATVLTSDNPYWNALGRTTSNLNLTVVPLVTPGSTDARFVRDAGYPAFGFSPMPNTELLLHSVNERLSAKTFLNGIDVYEALIPALANLAANQTAADTSVYVAKTAV